MDFVHPSMNIFVVLGHVCWHEVWFVIGAIFDSLAKSSWDQHKEQVGQSIKEHRLMNYLVTTTKGRWRERQQHLTI